MSTHECDCGARYSNLDALLACQNANHGRGSLGRDPIAQIMNDCFETAAKACEILGDQDEWPMSNACYRCAEAIRALKKEDK
jgi:hypothetical protein